MKKIKKMLLKATLCISLCMMMSVTAFAGVVYCNRFTSYKSNGYYKAYAQFIPAHVGASNEPYCKKGKQVKQAYVSAQSSNGYYSGRKYSSVSPSKKYNKTILTPTVSIWDSPFTTEYTYYGFIYYY